jgi:hypothetical protein
VTLKPGIRGFARTSFGKISAQYGSADRKNAYFQNLTRCEFLQPKIDVRNHTLAIAFTLGS